jgi:hypothetical protein
MENSFAYIISLNINMDYKKRHIIVESLHTARYTIPESGAGGYNQYPRFARCPRVSVGHEKQVGFMSACDYGNTLLLRKKPVKWKCM